MQFFNRNEIRLPYYYNSNIKYFNNNIQEHTIKRTLHT